jgi:hypothetical protein
VSGSAAVAVPAGAVLLFNTAAPSHLACRLHSATCPMVNTARARRGRGKVKLIESDVAECVADLIDRDWPVKTCKCLPR